MNFRPLEEKRAPVDPVLQQLPRKPYRTRRTGRGAPKSAGESGAAPEPQDGGGLIAAMFDSDQKPDAP